MKKTRQDDEMKQQKRMKVTNVQRGKRPMVEPAAKLSSDTPTPRTDSFKEVHRDIAMPGKRSAGKLIILLSSLKTSLNYFPHFFYRQNGSRWTIEFPNKRGSGCGIAS